MSTTTIDLTTPTMSDTELYQLASNYMSANPLGSFHRRENFGDRHRTVVLTPHSVVDNDILVSCMFDPRTAALDNVLRNAPAEWRKVARYTSASSDPVVIVLKDGRRIVKTEQVPNDLMALKIDSDMDVISGGVLRLLHAFSSVLSDLAIDPATGLKARLIREAANRIEIPEDAEVRIKFEFAGTHTARGRSIKVLRTFYQSLRAAGDVVSAIARSEGGDSASAISGHLRFGGIAIGHIQRQGEEYVLPVRLYVSARIVGDDQLRSAPRAVAAARGPVRQSPEDALAAARARTAAAAAARAQSAPPTPSEL